MIPATDDAGSATVASAPDRAWANPPERVLAALLSSPDGLSTAEVEERLRVWGPNVLEGERAVGAWAILLRQFRSPLIYILIVAVELHKLVRREPVRRPRIGSRVGWRPPC